MSDGDVQKDRVEQLEVQLAGCGTAALGYGVVTGEPAVQGEYGWSPSYQDVLDLRRKYEYLKERARTLAAYIDARRGEDETLLKTTVKEMYHLLDTERLPGDAVLEAPSVEPVVRGLTLRKIVDYQRLLWMTGGSSPWRKQRALWGVSRRRNLVDRSRDD